MPIPAGAYTNFAALTSEEKTLWSMDFWRKARNNSFVMKFAGTGDASIIQRITELKRTEKGARCVITLVNDLEGDGRAGDRQLEGYEEPMVSEEQVVRVDQLRHANKHKGRMAEQKSVVAFREQSRDKLAYWIGDRLDQMAFLSLSGVAFDYHTNGAARVGSDLPLLEYAADVAAPTAGRHFRWDATTGLTTADTAAVATADTPSWAMLVETKAYAKERYVRPALTKDGIPFYHVFMTPTGMAKLRQDSDYLANVRNAGVRGPSNELFKGVDGVYVDGMLISEYRHVYNTRGLTATNKWGSSGNVEGQRVLFCGAQALGMGDLGKPYWVEKEFDYDNQPGISIGKICGFKKPQFEGKLIGGKGSGVVEDFGVICVDTAIGGAD